jgi:hypothetical protein
MDGTLWILLLFCLVYSWLLFNLAALLASLFKRFSLRTLFVAMTIASLLMGAAAMALRH